MAPPRTIATRQLGKDGPQVPSLGFGLMGLSVAYGEAPPDEERLKVLDRAWELGATFWDSAAAYGDNEILIGKWFQLHPERRGDIFLATKFALGWKLEDGKFTTQIDSSPECCRESCEKSLRTLGVDSIDLFYVHRFDAVTPVEKTMEALVQLKKEGKIKNIGFSECSSNTLRRGHAVHPIAAVQIEYNPWSLEIEDSSGTNLLATCRELGVAIVTYSPLGRGFLTGAFQSIDDLPETDNRRLMPRFAPENFANNVRLVKVFEELARKKGCEPSQVVLAWIMAQGEDFFPIPGTKKVKYLEENMGALGVEVGEEEDGFIREAMGELGGASGERTVGVANAYADTVALPV